MGDGSFNILNPVSSPLPAKSSPKFYLPPIQLTSSSTPATSSWPLSFAAVHVTAPSLLLPPPIRLVHPALPLPLLAASCTTASSLDLDILHLPFVPQPPSRLVSTSPSAPLPSEPTPFVLPVPPPAGPPSSHVSTPHPRRRHQSLPHLRRHQTVHRRRSYRRSHPCRRHQSHIHSCRRQMAHRQSCFSRTRRTRRRIYGRSSHPTRQAERECGRCFATMHRFLHSQPSAA